MAGFFKGMVIGLAIGVAGFVVAAFLSPPNSASDQIESAAPPPEPEEPPETEGEDDALREPEIEGGGEADTPAEAGAHAEAESTHPTNEPNLAAQDEPALEPGEASQPTPVEPEATQLTSDDPLGDEGRIFDLPDDHAVAADDALPEAELETPDVAPAEEEHGTSAPEQSDDEAVSPDEPLRDVAPEAGAATQAPANPVAVELTNGESLVEREDDALEVEPAPGVEPGERLEEATADETPEREAGADITATARALAEERAAVGGEDLLEPAEDEVIDREELTTERLDQETPGTALEDDDAPAWERYAADFQPPAERSLFAVLLVDAPADAEAEAALLALRAPVTVALDPSDPDAPRRAIAYRSAGHEVALLVAEPVEVDELAAQRDTIPEAVAWLVTAAAFSEGSDDAQQLNDAIAESGLALVVQDESLVSDAEGGVPRARLVTTIDPALDERSEVLALFDRVAHDVQAGQAVALVGRAAHPQMLEALQQRAGRRMEAAASPAPLSAALAAARR
jgi:uncharacterized protein